MMTKGEICDLCHNPVDCHDDTEGQCFLHCSCGEIVPCCALADHVAVFPSHYLIPAADSAVANNRICVQIRAAIAAAEAGP